MRSIFAILLASIAAGCGNGIAPGAQPGRAASCTNAWTDFSGDYQARRVIAGYPVNHVAFFDETELRPGAHVSIIQASDQRLAVVYESRYNETLTNVIETGANWRWANGDLVYTREWTGNTLYIFPGRVTQRRDCLVRRGVDGTITVRSSHQGGGRLFWAVPWSDPGDLSEIELAAQGTPARRPEIGDDPRSGSPAPQP